MANSWQTRIKTLSANHTITDSEGYEVYLVTTGASTITITLPTAADNSGKQPITIMKVDSGAGKVVVDGEGAETIHSGGIDFATFELLQQSDFVKLLCDGTQWLKINPPYLHFIKAEDRSGTLDLSDASVSTTWETCDLSALVPVGTIGVYGRLDMWASDGPEYPILWTREYGSAENTVTECQTMLAYADVNVGGYVGIGAPITLMAPNGKWDYREHASDASYAVAEVQYELWGWIQ